MKLRLFTANYPYGFNESYLNNELPYLAKEFDDISIYPYIEDGALQTSYGNQGTIFLESNKESQSSLTFSDKLFIFKIYLIEFFHMKHKWFFIKKSRRFYAILKKGVLLSNWIESKNMNKEDVYYSYWMNEWAIALAVLKKKGKIAKFVFRINGYDIWDERHEENYLPYRYFIYSQMEKVIPLSKTSAEYVKNLNIFPEKVEHGYFGTTDIGNSPDRNDDKYVIFSCSTAIPLKRLQKIAEVVCQLKFPVKWVHHGEGPTMEEVNEFMKKAPANIEYSNTRKMVDYFAVLEMEKNLSPDLFINLSTTEGLPVTIMEAMSFGIPILVNDVGSCKEFINDLTGIMVEADASVESIANEIIKLKESKKAQKDKLEIKKFWYDNFSAEKNYTKFAKDLKELF